MRDLGRLKPATILIVEDQAIVRLDLADWLEELGLTVLEASHADEAIALLNIHPKVDLLLTDLKMPGSMDGMCLTHHVRKRWPAVKIIVISGMDEALRSDLPLGSLFLSKPCPPQQLWGALSYLTG